MRCNPSANQIKQKKGLWSPEEDKKLKDYILNHGLGCWSSVPINAGLQRNGKSCRLRWTNYLRPGLKRGTFTTHEEQIILTLHGMLGNKWSQMSQHLPGRSDNEIKNHWHSCLKKKIVNLENIKADPTPLDMLNDESSSSSLKSTRAGSSIESSQDIEILSIDAKPLRIPPKILFADWLLLDQFQLFRNSDELSISGDAFYNTCSGDIQEGPRVTNLELSSEHQNLEIDFCDLIFEEIMCPNFNINAV
ncbi:hypothetical protein L1887_23282 [Cichorium endivia]|nr:hypothetical protein L1887_23282 [Cichorium endivia]